MIRNELVVGLLDFTHYIFELLGNHADEAVLTTVEVGGVQTTYLDPIPLLRNRIASGEIFQVEEIDSFLDELLHEEWSDPKSNQTGPRGEKERKVELARVLVEFFEHFFRSRGTWEIDHVELVGRFDQELEFWERRAYPVHGVVVLAGFDGEGGVQKLGSGLEVRPLPPLARERYMQGAPQIREIAAGERLYILDYVVAQEEWSDEEERSGLPLRVEAALVGLKLLKSGDFSVLFVRQTENGKRGPEVRFWLSAGHSSLGVQEGKYWESFDLLEAQCEPLRQILAGVEKGLKEKSSLPGALRRFAESYHRPTIEGRFLALIDTMALLASGKWEPRKRLVKWVEKSLGQGGTTKAEIEIALEVGRLIEEEGESYEGALKKAGGPSEEDRRFLRRIEEIARTLLVLAIEGSAASS